MASKEDLTDQLAITQKLTASIDSMARALGRVEEQYTGQLAAVEKLSKAIESLGASNLDSLNKIKFDKFKKNLETSEKQTKSLTGRLKELAIGVGKKLTSPLVAAAGGLSGLAQGFRNLVALTKVTTTFFGGLLTSVTSTAASILTFPLHVFQGLIDLAAKMPGSTALAEALQNLKKEFGDFAGPSAGGVLKTTKTFKGFSDTGLSIYRVFGNLAERLQYVTKLAVAMGPVFTVLHGEFEANGGALMAFQRGLGIADEGMLSLGQRAISSGRPMSRILLDMTKQTTALGKAFGISQKVIGQDMSKALIDVAHFGQLTVKQIAEASVYSQKLGVSLDKIVGVLDAFETFDSAAENAAKLSQAFGVNIDAFAMMEAQNPAEQLDMLRKSFRSAGIDAASFTRQQAKLLAQSTNLSEEVVRQTFAASNYGTSLDDIKKQSEGAEKKTMSQADAMAELSKSIDHMVKAGANLENGFFKQFFSGFLKGIQMSHVFRGTMLDIREGLRKVRLEGVELGKAFVKTFPGIQKLLEGIREFFQPAKFVKLFHGISTSLQTWMSSLTESGGKASFKTLMENLRKHFFDFFDSQNPASKKMLEGFKTVLKTMSVVVSEGVKWLSSKLAEGMQYVTDLLTGKVKLPSANSGGALGFLAEILIPIVDALVESWKTIQPKLLPLVKIIGTKLMEAFKSDTFIGAIKPGLGSIAGILFGPALMKALLSVGVKSLANAAVGLFTSPQTKQVMGGVAEAASKQISDASQKIGKTRMSMGGIDQVTEAKAAAEKAMGSNNKWSPKDALDLGAKLLAFAGAMAVGGIAMSYALVAMKSILKGLTAEDLVVPLVALTGAATAAIPLTIAMKIASKAGSPAQLAMGGLIISAAVGAVGLVSAGIAVLMKSAGKPEQLVAAGKIMTSMTLVFLGMAPLIVAATAIGAVVIATGGLALVPMLAGLGIMATAVGGMAEMSVQLIEKISKIKVDAGFQGKIDAFLGVMTAIGSFAGIFTGLIENIAPSFTELISGNAVSFPEKAKSAKELIATMVGERGGSGLIGIMETVMQAVAGMGFGGEGMIAAANTFASVMSAITEFMKVATPPDAFFQASGGFLDKVAGKLTGSGSDNIGTIATASSQYIWSMVGGINMILLGKDGNSGIMAALGKIASMTMPSPEAMASISGLFKAIGGIMSSMTPSPDILKAFTSSTTADSKYGIVRGAIKKLDSGAMVEMITTMTSQMSTIIPALLDGALNSIIAKAAQLTPEKIKNVKTLADVMSTVSSITTALSNMSGQLTPSKAAAGATTSAPGIKALLDSYAQSMPGIIQSALDLSNAVSGFKNVSNTIKSGAIMPALKAVSEMVRRTQELDDQLTKLPLINVAAKLKSVASAAGLGGSAVYTVKSKEVVINLNLSVTMDAGEVEKVMIMRTQSIIRDRLNFATAGESNSTIPETYTRNTPKISRSTQ